MVAVPNAQFTAVCTLKLTLTSRILWLQRTRIKTWCSISAQMIKRRKMGWDLRNSLSMMFHSRTTSSFKLPNQCLRVSINKCLRVPWAHPLRKIWSSFIHPWSDKVAINKKFTKDNQKHPHQSLDRTRLGGTCLVVVSHRVKTQPFSSTSMEMLLRRWYWAMGTTSTRRHLLRLTLMKSIINTKSTTNNRCPWLSVRSHKSFKWTSKIKIQWLNNLTISRRKEASRICMTNRSLPKIISHFGISLTNVKRQLWIDSRLRRSK